MSTRGQQRYAQYLMSGDWKQRREQALYRAQYLCQSPTCRLGHLRSLTPQERHELVPRTRYRLEVHHLTYERLGHEHPDDLIVLCSDCHADQHGMPLPEKDPCNTTNIADAVAGALEQMLAAFKRGGT